MSNSSPISSFVGCIVKAPDGKILCQLRDEKPGITFPGYWTCTPGGHVEEGEDIFKAIMRELKEEFDIEIQELVIFMRRTERSGPAAGRYHFFAARLKSPVENIRCFEGQKAVLFSSEEAMTLNLHPLSRQALEAYMKSA